MCVTTERTTQNRRRSKRRSVTQDEERKIAIDDPPPILDIDSGMNRVSYSRTPEHIVTFRLPNTVTTTPPLFVQNQFLVQGTVDGKIAIYTASKMIERAKKRNFDPTPQEDPPTNQNLILSEPDHLIDTAPFFRDNNNRTSSKCQEESPMVTCAPLQSKVVAINVLGHVSMLNPSASRKSIVYCTWKTGRPNVSSCSCTLRGCIAVGYRDGCVEGWRVVAAKDGPVAKLLWRAWSGAFQPVTSVCQLTSSSSDSLASASEDSSSEPIPELVAVAQDNGKVHVLDVSAMEVAWRQRKNEASVDDSGASLDFRDYWVLAEPGRELRALSCVEDVFPSSICPLEEGGILLAIGKLLTVLSAHVQNGKLVWGVSKLKASKCQLPYPSVGLGLVELERPGRSPWTRHVPQCVCALRAGSVYIIPMADLDVESHIALDDDVRLPIQTILYPRDGDEEIESPKYLQGFTAGMLDQGESESLPVMFFSWPGGIVDVYSCRLLDCVDAPTPEQHLLADLYRDGTIDTLKTTVLMDIDPPGSANPAFWEGAKQELMVSPDVQEADLLDQSEEPSKYASFKRLILQLAQDEA